MNSVCFPMKSMSRGVQYLVIVQFHQHNQRTGIPAKLIQEAMRTWVQPKPDKDRIETTAHQRTCCRLQNPYQCKASPAPVPSACCSENVPAQELPRRSMDKYADCPGLDIWLSARACRLRKPLAPSRLVLGLWPACRRLDRRLGRLSHRRLGRRLGRLFHLHGLRRLHGLGWHGLHRCRGLHRLH